MTPETPTPETDAAARRGAYIKAPSLYYETSGKQLVHIDDARKLERERDAARAKNAAMWEVVAAAEKCRHWHDCSYNPETGETEGVIISAVSFWELRAALAKLKPFITDAPPTKP